MADSGHTASLTTETGSHDDITVLRVAGVVDLATAEQLEQAIDAALADGPPAAFVIDLSGVDFLASVGMAILVATRQRLGEETRFAVVADGPATGRPLTLTGLDQVLAVHRSLPDALAG
jgi:anti-anti-sigma factor